MNITESAIAKARREAKNGGPKKVADGHGLYLLIRPNGSAAWRHKFNFGTKICEGPSNKGKEVPHEWLDTLGHYPETSIKDARRLHAANRALLDAGKNPLAAKRHAKAAESETFAIIAERYVKNQEHRLAASTIRKYRWELGLVYPVIGDTQITALTAKEVLKAIHKIESHGVAGKRTMIETAHKTLELIAAILDSAVSADIVAHNVARGRSKAIRPRVKRHHPAITKEPEIGMLLRKIAGYEGQPATMAALQLLPHVFLRNRELRHGHWDEIDFRAAQWNIPAARMKGKRDHIVPLSAQSVAILKDLKTKTGDGPLMFPAIGPRKRPISENTLGAALRVIGYTSEQLVPHGIRTMASTLLHERFPSIDVELQLAHADRDKVRDAYNRAERIKQRATMMQQWSNLLDQLRDQTKSDNVVAFAKKRTT